jgi:hypothetical protein
MVTVVEWDNIRGFFGKISAEIELNYALWSLKVFLFTIAIKYLICFITFKSIQEKVNVDKDTATARKGRSSIHVSSFLTVSREQDANTAPFISPADDADVWTYDSRFFCTGSYSIILLESREEIAPFFVVLPLLFAINVPKFGKFWILDVKVLSMKVFCVLDKSWWWSWCWSSPWSIVCIEL